MKSTVDLQKLKVILLERHQDPVLLFLSKDGLAQYIKVDCENEDYSEILQACQIPNEDAQKNLDLKTRIKRKLEELDLKSKTIFDKNEVLPGNTIKEILTNLEKKLSETEEKIDRILELENLEDSKKRTIKESSEDSKKRSAKLRKEKVDHYVTLSTLQRMTKEIDILLEAKINMAQCDTVVYIEAWIIKKQLPRIKREITAITDGKCVIKDEKPIAKDNVPNVIKRKPRFFEGFEIISYSLGFPRKGEFNPTYLLAFTFPFLFGIMFADVGHGAILLFGGILLYIARGKADMNTVGEIPKYLLLSAGIITLCGISAIIWGFIFGEFFGPSGLLHPILVAQIGPFKIGGFDPAHEPLTMIRFTVLIGVIFISFTLILRFLNHLRRKEVAHALASLCWIWFILGGFFMWVYWKGISQITTWFGEGLPMLLGLVIAPLMVAMLIIAISEELMEGVNFSVEVFIESLGHTLSFCRLAALFLAHTALSTMFLDLGGVENGNFPPSSWGLVAIGTILILCIEGLIVMVHTLRLHWIELVPKFYSAKGILFEPIMIK